MAISPEDVVWSAEWALRAAREEENSPSRREVLERIAVKALYYSCFSRALALAEARGYALPKGRSTHEALWDCWYQTENADTREIASAAKSLREFRIDADYHLSLAWATQIEDAVEYVTLFDEAFTKHESAVIAEGRPQRRAWDRTIYERAPKDLMTGHQIRQLAGLIHRALEAVESTDASAIELVIRAFCEEERKG